MVDISYWFVNSLTGQRELRVYPAAGSWRSKLNGVDGARTHTVMVRDRHTPIQRAAWLHVLQPWMMRFVVDWDGKPKYAGWVLGHDWDSDTGRLLVKHSDFRAIASRRALFGVGNVPTEDIVIEGRSLRGLMGEYAWRALVNGGWRWALRLVVEEADRLEAGPHTETIKPTRFDTLESLMRGLHTRDGGPEAHFAPRWSETDGGLEEVLRIGTPELRTNTIEVHASADRSPLRKFGYAEDGESQLTGVWGIAEGRGEDGIIGRGGDLPGPDTPFLDKPYPIKSTTDQDVADEQANGILRTFRSPIKQYRFQIADPALSARTEIGTVLRAYHNGDELQPPGWIDGRAIGMSHDVADSDVTLEVQ